MLPFVSLTVPCATIVLLRFWSMSAAAFFKLLSYPKERADILLPLISFPLAGLRGSDPGSAPDFTTEVD